MTEALRSAILRAWWPGPPGGVRSVWAILDGARDPRIAGILGRSRLEVRCLYSGPLPRALESAAPQLVELLPGHPLTSALLDDGWGRSWGVFLRLEDAANLRHHLRKFLRVVDEQGRRLLFRYYDPRVLRAFLPTCTPAQLGEFFGPVGSWYAEEPGGAGLLAYTLGAQGLQVERLAAA